MVKTYKKTLVKYEVGLEQAISLKKIFFSYSTGYLQKYKQLNTSIHLINFVLKDKD